MRSFLLNKLIRDKVLASMQALGQQAQHTTLDHNHFLVELRRKLLEEAQEFDPSNQKACDELADLMEVIEYAAKALGKNYEELRQLQIDRRSQRGGFDKQIYVGRLDLLDDDPWVDYYAAEPERFPEIAGK